MKDKKKAELLESLKKKMEKDKTLPLREGATNLVFSDGSPGADVMFIGEGPGYWEDVKSLPFVGNAGALLNQLLASIKLPRKEVFITNVVHHRPPGNRDPLPEELEAYALYLDKMIKIINPKLIVTLGRFSMGKFLPGVTITNVHGKERKIKWKDMDIVVLPMYHPAAGLRNGEIKRRLMDDFKRIPEVLESVEKIEIEKDEKNEQAEQMQLV